MGRWLLGLSDGHRRPSAPSPEVVKAAAIAVISTETSPGGHGNRKTLKYQRNLSNSAGGVIRVAYRWGLFTGVPRPAEAKAVTGIRRRLARAIGRIK